MCINEHILTLILQIDRCAVDEIYVYNICLILQIDRCAADEIYDADNKTKTQCCTNDVCRFMFIDYIKEHLNMESAKGIENIVQFSTDKSV